MIKNKNEEDNILRHGTTVCDCATVWREKYLHKFDIIVRINT